jgi:hypothetical protein
MSVRARVVVLCLMFLASACGPQFERLGPSSSGASSVSATSATWPLRGTPAPNAAATGTRPLVVKVAADPAARPQSGLADADLVLEIPVEGGLTRYAVVFQSKDPQKVGPVRSARQSDLNYLSALHAIVAHVGASEPVTKLIRDAASANGFVDVDEFQHPDAFERTSDRVAPYNAFTSGAKIRQVAPTDQVAVAPLSFGDAPSSGKDAASVTVRYSDGATYTYDSARGGYHRTYGGGATTADGATEVMPENVVVISTDVTEIPGTADAAGAPSVDYRAKGSGPVVVLRDGKRYDGTWSRDGAALYSFTDASGSAIRLKPGLTWIHIVPMDVRI